MYKRILVPMDGSEFSVAAVQAATQLAKSVGASIVAIHVMPILKQLIFSEYSFYDMMAEDEFNKATAEEATHIFATAQKEAAKAEVPSECITRLDSSIFRAFIDAATEHKCDLILMASHGRSGIASLLLGSETTKVLTHCRIPVLVYR